ncbi:hypothetical protein MMC09_004694 [Bachmanniomyces sp. S44760]|nr:hypothetical protein [Bachmanniomyces sp. S44760]
MPCTPRKGNAAGRAPKKTTPKKAPLKTLQLITEMEDLTDPETMGYSDDNEIEPGVIPWPDLNKAPLVPEIEKRDRQCSSLMVGVLKQDCRVKTSAPGSTKNVRWNPYPPPVDPEEEEEDLRHKGCDVLLRIEPHENNLNNFAFTDLNNMFVGEQFVNITEDIRHIKKQIVVMYYSETKTRLEKYHTAVDEYKERVQLFLGWHLKEGSPFLRKHPRIKHRGWAMKQIESSLAKQAIVMDKFDMDALTGKLKRGALTLFNENKRNKTHCEFFD